MALRPSLLAIREHLSFQYTVLNILYSIYCTQYTVLNIQYAQTRCKVRTNLTNWPYQYTKKQTLAKEITTACNRSEQAIRPSNVDHGLCSPYSLCPFVPHAGENHSDQTEVGSGLSALLCCRRWVFHFAPSTAIAHFHREPTKV